MNNNLKEAKFAFYNVSFEHTNDLTIPGVLPLNQAVGKFNELFERNSLPIKGESQSEIFPNHIYKVEPEVFLIRIHKQEIIRYIRLDEKEDGKDTCSDDFVKSYPYLYAVVDNRNGRSQIALNLNASFGKSMDKLCKLLTSVFNAWMNPYGLKADISECKIPLKFWTYVDQCQKEGRRLLHLNIGFYNRANKTFNSPLPLRQNIEGLLNLLESMGGAHAFFKVFAPSSKEERMQLESKMKDLAQIVVLCSSNDFSLECKFYGQELYKFSGDENMKAVFDMPGNALTEMVEAESNPQGAIEWPEGTKCSIVLWLDEVNAKIYDYNYKAQRHESRIA